jgi:hypothetical protein
VGFKFQVKFWVKFWVNFMSCLVADNWPSLPPTPGEGDQSPSGSSSVTLTLPGDCMAKFKAVVDVGARSFYAN